MSYLLTYTSLNDESTAAFSKTQTSMKKTNLADKAKSSLGNTVILMFTYLVQIHINVFFYKNTIVMMMLENYVIC